METTEPMVLLAYLIYAVFFTGVGFMVMQGAVDDAMHFNDMEATGLNTATAKNFYLMNHGERFGKFTEEELESLKAGPCGINLPSYIEQKPLHKVDEECRYFEGVGVLGLKTYAVVTGSANSPRVFETSVPEEVLETPGDDS